MRRFNSIWRLRLLLFLLISVKYVNTHQNNNAQQQTPGHQLSSRVVQTKYGALRGAVIYFQNQPSPSNQHNGQSTNEKSTSSTNGQNNNKQTNTNYLQPVEFFLGVPYATGKKF